MMGVGLPLTSQRNLAVAPSRKKEKKDKIQVPFFNDYNMNTEQALRQLLAVNKWEFYDLVNVQYGNILLYSRVSQL